MSAAVLCGWEAPEPLQGIILAPLGAGHSSKEGTENWKRSLASNLVHLQSLHL